MSIQKFKDVGVRFNYSEYSDLPEIPYTQDVLYALRLSKEQKYYDFCWANHELYINNVRLAAAVIGSEVFHMYMFGRYDEDRVKKIIAEMIIKLCPPEAKCLFNSAFVEAQIMAGKEDWQYVLSASREVLRHACTHCRVSQ